MRMSSNYEFRSLGSDEDEFFGDDDQDFGNLMGKKSDDVF
jgi:hypothetical protein